MGPDLALARVPETVWAVSPAMLRPSMPKEVQPMLEMLVLVMEVVVGSA
jgi:hypothetical protein